MQRKKLEQELEEDFDAVLDNIQEQGASCLKYEFINKRDQKGQEKKVLVAMRCSLRNKVMGLESAHIDPTETTFEYEPTEMECLFSKDQHAQKVRQVAIQKSFKVEISDIAEVLGFI